MIQRILLVSILFALLVGCSSKSKDIYFRSRLPTGETPHFKEQGKFGFNLELESDRFVVKTTKNLVTDFSFHQEPENASFYNESGRLDLRGADLSLSYTLPIPFPIELAASTDFAELKIGLLGFQSGKKNSAFLLLNGGYYKSAHYTDDGVCSGRAICFQSADSGSDADNISTSMNGKETKVGGNLGYFFDNGNAIYASYNWMNYSYSAEATQKTTPFQSISFEKSIFGMGTGLGYMFSFSSGGALSLSADNVRIMSFHANYDQIIYGIKLNL